MGGGTSLTGSWPPAIEPFDSLRLEKGYRYWSADIGPDYTPFEAGLGFAVKLNKGDFIGREALLKQKETGLQRKLCCLTLADSYGHCHRQRTHSRGRLCRQLGYVGWLWLLGGEEHRLQLFTYGVCCCWHGAGCRNYGRAD